MDVGMGFHVVLWELKKKKFAELVLSSGTSVVAGVPGVTETLFLARQSALAEEKKKLDETPMMYSCGLCGKGYRSAKAHAQHLQSKSHLVRASEGTSKDEGTTIIKPLARRVAKESSHHVEQEVEESEDSEWEEVDSEDDLVGRNIYRLSTIIRLHGNIRATILRTLRFRRKAIQTLLAATRIFLSSRDSIHSTPGTARSGNQKFEQTPQPATQNSKPQTPSGSDPRRNPQECHHKDDVIPLRLT
ncbi:Zinc finger protein [Forsythia ovata]|uniref:Zinc finger protein n=1 Tax=Forsythia ovata TaxID=205694 RepID=A0ABD1UV79_9LAMI